MSPTAVQKKESGWATGATAKQWRVLLLLKQSSASKTLQFSFCGTDTEIRTGKMENCLGMIEAEKCWMLSLC